MMLLSIARATVRWSTVESKKWNSVLSVFFQLLHILNGVKWQTIDNIGHTIFDLCADDDWPQHRPPHSRCCVNCFAVRCHAETTKRMFNQMGIFKLKCAIASNWGKHIYRKYIYWTFWRWIFIQAFPMLLIHFRLAAIRFDWFYRHFCSHKNSWMGFGFGFFCFIHSCSCNQWKNLYRSESAPKELKAEKERKKTPVID